MSSNVRLEAFCSPQVYNCFQSIVYESEIWKRDPYDVESIHPEARETFEYLIHQVRNKREGVGKIWLIKGVAGAGKTHLMRVFRNHLHDTGSGYFSYMQMTSAGSNYPRYILRNTLDSLDKPYTDDPTGSITGLMRLSRTLAERQAAVHPDQLRKLQEADLKRDELIELVFSLADEFTTLDEFDGIDLGLIRALLFLQYDNAPLKRCVMSYLRCEHMPEQDVRRLDMPARTDDDAPQTLLKSLTRLIWALDAGVLVLCLDQLEDMYQDNADSAQRFRNAIQATNALIGQCPRLLVLVSCLEDYYLPLRQQLTKAALDRIENDPLPTVISAYPRCEAIKDLITRRLEMLYESTNVDFDDTNPLYPFPDELIDALDGQPIRGILDRCRELRDKSIHTKQIPRPIWPGPGPKPPTSGPPRDTPTKETLLAWNQRWNDFLTTATPPPLRDDIHMKYMLYETIRHCGNELNQRYQFELNLKGNNIIVDTLDNDHSLGSTVVSLCNKSARGGALAKQLSEAASSTTPERLIIARNTPFPDNPKTKIAQQIAQLFTRGMKRVVIEDSDWRAMVAMGKFKDQYGKREGFIEWLTTSRPLSLRPALKTILELINVQKPDQPEPIEPVPKPDTPPEPVDTQPDDPIKPPIDGVSMLQLGVSRDYKPEPVTININQLTRHAAFLGISGSGKTTLALNIIEQLLQQGVPALMIDRKGDLASYAQAYQLARQSESSDKQALAEDAKNLMERLDVALYTPGNSQGRPLSIPIIPQGMEQLSTNEREQMAKYAALALGGMMGYKPQGAAKTLLAILIKAISVLVELREGSQIVLNDLIAFIASEDSQLMYAIGPLGTAKHLEKLVENLKALQLMHGNLFVEEGELLDFEALLGLGKFQLPGRTRLSIISTTFLGDASSILFWIAQLLLEIDRYRRRQPSDQLQCVILFDEADLYLPATRKPATKEPLENLLRRGRSAGIGLMLATQSPGDLDYNSRDQISSWFLGRIKESNSLNRLRPMLSQTKLDIKNKLPSQETGQFFFISEGQVTSLEAQNSLIKVEQLPEDSILQLARS